MLRSIQNIKNKQDITKKPDIVTTYLKDFFWVFYLVYEFKLIFSPYLILAFKLILHQNMPNNRDGLFYDTKRF